MRKILGYEFDSLKAEKIRKNIIKKLENSNFKYKDILINDLKYIFDTSHFYLKRESLFSSDKAIEVMFADLINYHKKKGDIV